MQIGPADKVGRSFGGYRVERLLGRGGMGSVFAARDGAGRPAVLKFMESALDPKLRKRFQREGEALLRIRSHPHVVTVHQVEVEAQVPFLVMELVDGVSLERATRDRRTFPTADAARLIAQVASGLEAVHSYGLVHRDVKPENVIVTPGGRACLVDFGVAKDQFQTSLTRPGQLVGTAPYIAPELWEGERPTPAADLFSLGATLYAICLGRAPFSAVELTDLSELILEGEYPRPRELNAAFPSELEAIIAQALEPELRFRYRRAQDMLADLERFLRAEPVSGVALERADRRRVSLLGVRRALIGSAPQSVVQVDGEGVAAQHAELRRTATGYALADLSKGATRIDGRQPDGLFNLEHGAQIQVGGVALRFLDPRGLEQPTPLVPGDLWAPAPRLVVDALIELGDPRAVAEVLTRWTPDRDAERRLRDQLRGVLDPAQLEALVEERAKHLEREGLAAPRILCAASAEGPRAAGWTREDWLRWWDRVRARLPAQLCTRGVARPIQLLVGDETCGLTLDGRGGVVIGRDERCHVTVADKTVSRLHASLVPHLQRWFVRDEGSSYGLRLNGQRVDVALAEAGAALRVGDVELRLTRAEEAPEATGRIDPLALRLLERRGHPATAASLVRALRAASDDGWVAETTRRLFPNQPQRSQALAAALRRALDARAQTARAVLPGLLGAPAESLSALDALVRDRAAALGVQVAAEDED